MRQFDAVSVAQVLEVIRQLFREWHFGAVDKHGNYGNIPPQCRRSFKTNKVSGIVEAPPSSLILGVNPSLADDRQQDAAGGNAVVNRLTKIATRLDRRYIHENRVLAEDSDELVKRTSRLALGVVSTVAYEDRTHSSLPACSWSAQTL